MTILPKLVLWLLVALMQLFWGYVVYYFISSILGLANLIEAYSSLRIIDVWIRSPPVIAGLILLTTAPFASLLGVLVLGKFRAHNNWVLTLYAMQCTLTLLGILLVEYNVSKL